MGKHENFIDQESLQFLANYIKEYLTYKDYFRNIRIFLCGGSVYDKTSIRAKIQRHLISKNKSILSKQFEISYPEELFDELLMSKKYDLLSLENILAESVDVIIIAVESPGAYAELGAFVMDQKLIKKTIAVSDSKFKKSRSFINQGPIKLLKKNNTKSVIYLDSENEQDELNSLVKNIHNILNINKNDVSELTLLNIDTFILPLLFVTGELSLKIILELVKIVVKNKEYYEQITLSCLADLHRKRLIEKRANKYRLSFKGIDKFNSRIAFKGDYFIDKIRLKYLNLYYRKKRLVSSRI